MFSTLGMRQDSDSQLDRMGQDHIIGEIEWEGKGREGPLLSILPT